MLDNIRIVMVNTFHPGNIGAAARALKNMGLSQLWLVEPRDFPHPEAHSRAAGAGDLLDSAVVVDTVEAAIEDCQLVIGSSARRRSFDQPLLDAEEAAVMLATQARAGQVAILFGRETTGLTNREMLLCNRHLYIDAAADYPVLNIAQAIQLVTYELRRASRDRAATASPEPACYPRQGEIARFYQHLEQVLRRTGFIIPQHEGRVMDKLRRYFNRTRPEKAELGMLRGILTSVEEALEREHR